MEVLLGMNSLRFDLLLMQNCMKTVEIITDQTDHLLLEEKLYAICHRRLFIDSCSD